MLAPAAASAAPACPGLLPYTQPDGSVIMIRIEGDEFARRYYDADNVRLAADADGALRRATAAEIAAQDSEAQTAMRLRSAAMRGPGIKSSATFPHTGSPRAVVILVEFSDVKFTTPNPRDYFSRMLNEEGFSDYGAAGSARDYYKSQSRGQFVPQFDVYGPVAMSYTRAKNAATGNVPTIVKDATSAVDSQVNFADYDNNGDGEIDNVYIIFAGVGGNYGGSNSIWPHNSAVSSSLFSTTKRDGKTLKHYAIAGEMGSTAGRPAGIGTFIHEFGHVLGLADHYTTNGDHNDYTPGFWDVMDWGCYLGDGNNGRCPCYFSAYQRMALDWESPAATLSASAASVELPAMADEPFFVKIETGRANDYYLLENRMQKGFDAALYNSGMLIWHIDAGFADLATGPNNNINHMAVELALADNTAGANSLYGDVWPGTSGNTTFDGSSQPPMFRWESSTSATRVNVNDRQVSNIARNASTGNVTFDFKGGSSTNVIAPAGSGGTGSDDGSYCIPAGNLATLSKFGDRYTTKLTIDLEDGSTTEIGPLQTSATSPLYCDQTLQSVTVAAGSSFTVTPTAYGSWMHSYLYIDWNGDGFTYTKPADYVDPDNNYSIRPGADLVYYSNWCPNDADPSATNPWYTSRESFPESEHHNYNPNTPFTVTIPEGTRPGEYRVRYKCHWQSLDPCGKADVNFNSDNSLEHMGGIVADFTIVVTRPATGGICAPEGNLNVKPNFGTRYTAKLTVADTDGVGSTEIGPLQTGSTSPLYYDMSLQKVEVTAGKPFTVTPDFTGDWCHAYLYVDWDGDGFVYTRPADYVDPDNNYSIRPGADLVFYSNWCPNDADPSMSNPWYTSRGTFGGSSSQHYYDCRQPITVTIPEGTAPGEYRMRYKCHWQSLDPCGNADVNFKEENSLASMGGIVADFTLVVKESEPEIPTLQVSVAANPANGGTVSVNGQAGPLAVQEGSTVTFSAVPAPDYEFVNWTGPDGSVAAGTATHVIAAFAAADEGLYTATFTPESSIGEITGTPAESAAAIYDMQGRRVSRPTRPGLYIIGGRKALLR